MTEPEFWNRHNSLLINHFYRSIQESSQFTFYKSVFKEKYYNFIRPTVISTELDFDQVNQLIEKQRDTGTEISFYVSEGLKDGYQDILVTMGYSEISSDIFLMKTMNRIYDINIDDFIEINQLNFQEFQKIAGETFPNYKNNLGYTQWCFDESLNHRDSFLNYVQQKGNRFTSFGSVLMSQDIGLAFLHNIGTLEKYRRQGQFLNLTKFLSNLAFEYGINTTYANVEKDGASYNGFKKLGFSEVSSNYIYSKS